MEARTRRELSMASRALDFASTHPVADPGFATVVQRLDAVVTRADAIALQQAEGTTGERTARARRRDLRPSIRRNQLRRLVRIAELAAETKPELAGQFKMPPAGAPNRIFIVAARAMLAAALPNKELFASLGIGATFIEELTGLLAQMESATEIAHNGRSNHIAARADLVALVRDCRSDVDVIETFYRATLPKDSDVLAAWASARNVMGPFHRAGDGAPPEAN